MNKIVNYKFSAYIININRKITFKLVVVQCECYALVICNEASKQTNGKERKRMYILKFNTNARKKILQLISKCPRQLNSSNVYVSLILIS